MKSTEVKQQPREWRLIDEMAFIDHTLATMPKAKRSEWLAKYYQASAIRKDWGTMDGQKIINYLERLIACQNKT